ncbi:hypothetical protein SCUP515_11318 [Seiridium cupressi]
MRLSILRWIDPPEYKAELEDAKRDRMDGTAEWILDHRKFLEWRRCSPEEDRDIGNAATGILWICGKPGSGKTILSGSIIEDFRRQKAFLASESQITTLTVCYYFFKQTTARKCTYVDGYRALVAQIFRSSHLPDQVSNAFAMAASDMTSDTRATEGELKGLIQHCLIHIIGLAEGMFLWARVMVDYLNSPALTRNQRENIIMDQTPGGLDRLEELYCCIQDRIESLDRPSRDLAHDTLLWVAHTNLSISELKDAVSAEACDINEKDDIEQFANAVIVSCRGLLEKRPSGVLKYIHLTAQQFAHRGPERVSRPPILPENHVAKALLAKKCMSYLTEKIPKQPLSGQLGVAAGRSMVKRQWPFLQYAASLWAEHILKVVCNSQNHSTMCHFLDIVKWVKGLLETGTSLLVWNEALYTLLGKDSSTMLHTTLGAIQLANQNQLEGPQNRLLRDLEDLFSDISVLGVFPNEYFRSQWGTPARSPFYNGADVNKACIGWKATYEIISIGDHHSERLLYVEIPIDALDVEVCLRQNFHAQDADWVCSFPLSISPNLEALTVLNKMINLEPARNITITTLDLPFDSRRSCWNRSRPFRNRSQRTFRFDRYTYQFDWSPTEKYLLFQDIDRKLRAWVDGGTCIRLFSANTHTPGSSKIIVINTLFKDSLSRGIHSWHFHPSEPLLVFQDDNSAYVWLIPAS